jgi:hypothetical protein
VEEDIELLQSIWSGLSELRKLGSWAARVCSEEFFQRLQSESRRAREEVLKESGNEEVADKAFQESIKRKFVKMNRDNLAKDTRISMILGLFEDAIEHERPAASFLTLCTVLEAIFIQDQTEEVTHRLATRVARLLAPANLESRVEYYEQTKKVYSARSGLVHGRDLEGGVKAETYLTALRLVRQSLQKIITDGALMKVYSMRVGSKSEKDKATEALRDLMLNLDLAPDGRG